MQWIHHLLPSLYSIYLCIYNIESIEFPFNINLSLVAGDLCILPAYNRTTSFSEKKKHTHTKLYFCEHRTNIIYANFNIPTIKPDKSYASAQLAFMFCGCIQWQANVNRFHCSNVVLVGRLVLVALTISNGGCGSFVDIGSASHIVC